MMDDLQYREQYLQSQRHRTLFEEIERGDREGVRRLLNEGVNINRLFHQGGWSRTALQQAVNQLPSCEWTPSSDDIICQLIEHGADINIQDSDGDTALSVAIKDANLNLMKYLLDNGGSLVLTTKEGLRFYQLPTSPEAVDIIAAEMHKKSSMLSTNGQVCDANQERKYNMSDIRSDCPNCGVGVLAPSNMAGRVGECPRCGHNFVVGNIVIDGTLNVVDDRSDEALIPIEPSIDISAIRFRSSRHKRFNNGIWNGSDDTGCIRGVEIRADPQIPHSFLVTIYKLDGVHSIWGDNIQMSPKQMRITSSSPTAITLRGFGQDRFGTSYSDYGGTLHLVGGVINYISMYMHDRNVRIDYYV